MFVQTFLFNFTYLSFVQFSCLAFLVLYAVILLTDLHPVIDVKEIMLIIWIFSLIIEEIRQVYSFFALFHDVFMIFVYVCILLEMLIWEL